MFRQRPGALALLSFIAGGSPTLALKSATQQEPLPYPEEWKVLPPGPDGDETRKVLQDKHDIMQATLPYPAAIGQMLAQCKRLNVPLEFQTVTTDDDYRLTLMRLPNPGAQPVFLQHGFCDSAWMWLHGAHPVALQLWRQGYDVWMGNHRGSPFSRGATWLNESVREATDPTGTNLGGKFWNFTMEDMAKHDLPTFISTVAKNTSKKLIYIGHSLGTTQMIIGSTLPGTREVLENNVDFFIALSPIAYIGHLKNKMMLSLMQNSLIMAYLKMQSHGWGLSMADIAAQVPMGFGSIVTSLMDYKGFVGFGKMDDPYQETAMRVHFPSGTSIKLLVHWSQLVTDGYLHKYDYGEKGNMLAYNATTPPQIRMESFPIPTALMFAEEDEMSPKEDQELFKAEFPKEQVAFMKTYPQYSHITWTWGGNLEYVQDILKLVAERTAKLQR